MRTTAGTRAALFAILAGAAACATPVGVERVDAREVHRQITANVLSTGRPSHEAVQGLRRAHIEELFRRDRPAALAALHERTLAHATPRDVFALAELSFFHAERGGGRPHYLASALYAYIFLFPVDPSIATDPLDARYRVAADLYNRAITAGLVDEEGDRVDLSSRTLPLPFGELILEARPETFVWANHRLDDFVPAAELEVRGLRDRHRRTGLGAPLAARVGERVGGKEVSESWLGVKTRVSATAVLRFDRVREQVAAGRVRGKLALYVAGVDRTTEIHGRVVPLEYEPTASLALSLSESRLWDLEILGFRGQEIELDARNNLVMLTPHRHGRIPVVLVHGTASSPARWAETVNEIWNDPELNQHYEAWLFFYNTGQPILYSAGQLRHALLDAFEILDPEGEDPGLRDVVVMGHSQGGLLTRLMAVDSEGRFWANVTSIPMDELDLQPETEKILRRSLFFEPVPQVSRVIFMATPHRGSFLAGRRVGDFAAGLVTMPVNLGRAGVDLFRDDSPAAVALRRIDRLPSSIDNMRPGAPFLDALNGSPFHPRVTAHSIVAVRRDRPPEGQSDGVVEYESAHLESAASEKIVISGHSMQGHPEAVAEVRRILLEHLRAVDAPDPEASVAGQPSSTSR